MKPQWVHHHIGLRKFFLMGPNYLLFPTSIARCRIHDKVQLDVWALLDVPEFKKRLLDHTPRAIPPQCN